MAKHLRTRRDGRYCKKELSHKELRVGDLFLYGAPSQPHYILEICSHSNTTPLRIFKYRIIGYRTGTPEPLHSTGSFSSYVNTKLSVTWKLAKPRKIQRLLADKVFISLT